MSKKYSLIKKPTFVLGIVGLALSGVLVGNGISMDNPQIEGYLFSGDKVKNVIAEDGMYYFTMKNGNYYTLSKEALNTMNLKAESFNNYTLPNGEQIYINPTLSNKEKELYLEFGMLGMFISGLYIVGDIHDNKKQKQLIKKS